MSIQSYSPARLCPKCFHNKVRTRWCDSTEMMACAREFFWSVALRLNHFHRVCENCSYQWFEAPPDYDPATDTPPCDYCGVSADPMVTAPCGCVLCPYHSLACPIHEYEAYVEEDKTHREETIVRRSGAL